MASSLLSPGLAATSKVIDEIKSNNYRVSTVMDIKNDTKYNLVSGSIFAVNGSVLQSPLVLKSNSSDFVATRKTWGLAKGTHGILSYTFENNPDKKIVVLWSAPFNFDFYKNRLGVGITTDSKDIDIQLFDQMIKDKPIDSLTYKIDKFKSARMVPVIAKYEDVVVEGTMSSDHNAYVKIHIRSESG
ncbi:tereporin-Ts1-like [Mya arenaria]|uniref:tereporin-Ts1-like n=1 Tax=Mya arenaria TaxID=6604 RepID=UPI0022E08520|nr:tereporin-Ts1-like [Mya arenaria]